jgi:hypothetical protein
MNKITKEEFLSLKSDTITRKDYNRILSKIDDRFNYIMREVLCKSISWWDYNNGDSKAEIDGFFEPDDYDEDSSIELAGEWSIPEPYHHTDFPIRWLWEDFEEEFKRDVLDYKVEKEMKKVQARVRREALKDRKEKMKEIISNKLTEEELKFITFK